MKYVSVCSGVEAATLAWEQLGWQAIWFSEIDPFPSAVLNQRWPNIPNMGDMTKIEVKEENGNQIFTNGNGTVVSVPGRVDLLVGGTPCFPANTSVLTPKGYVDIQDLKVGDEVISHLGNICKVSATGSKVANIGKLKILGRPEIECTPNHPFYTIGVKLDGRRKSETYSQVIANGDWEFVNAENSVGRYAGRLQSKQIGLPVLPKTNLTINELLELCGWYVGDGYIRTFKSKRKKTVILALVSENKIEKFKKKYDNKINFHVTKEGKIGINNTELAEFLIDNFGRLSLCKKIPYWLYSYEDLKQNFLTGLMETDGCLYKNYFSITTVSKSLAYGLGDLFPNGTIHFHKVEPTTIIEGRTVNQHNYYVFALRLKKTKYLKQFNNRYCTKIRRFDNDLGTNGIVYNITVAGDHTYVVNGIAVHNCQSFSVAGKREGLDGASGLARTYVELLKTIKPKWFVWENVPGVFSSKDKESGVYDFNFLMQQFANCGYSLAWRVLDAQWIRTQQFPRAIPQRRRRVFVVGYFGDEWEKPCKVLFEPESEFRNTPPSRIKGKGFTRNIETSFDESSWIGKSIYGDSSFGGYSLTNISPTLRCGGDTSTTDLILNGAEFPYVSIGVGNTISASHPGNQNCIVSMDLKKVDNIDFDVCSTICGSDYKGGKLITTSIGNGQICGLMNSTVELAQTLHCMHDQQAILIEYKCYENHSNDSRVKDMGNVCQTLSTRLGTGGNNQPLVQSFYKWHSPAVTASVITDNCSPTIVSAMGMGGPNMTTPMFIVDCYSLAENIIGRKPNNGGNGNGYNKEVCFTINTSGVHAVNDFTTTIRRLTPLECERLMGFTDNHTRISWNGKSAEDCPDSHRYKACGNSMCVNVMEWIGRRIQLVEDNLI